ncbi:MAG: ribosome maturation factor RimM [Cyanobacteria bacterium P01_A01_bin.105]
MTLPDGWISIGRIVGPHGRDGEVRVYPNSDFPERFLAPGERWLLKARAKAPEAIQLLEGRYLPGKGLYLLKLAGINYRDQAEALREAQLLVSTDDRLPLDPGEFHVDDLIGLTALLQANGTIVGTVSDVFTAGNDLLEVTLTEPVEKVKKVLVPFVEEIVPVVDLANHRVEINPPDGLFP